MYVCIIEVTIGRSFKKAKGEKKSAKGAKIRRKSRQTSPEIQREVVLGLPRKAKTKFSYKFTSASATPSNWILMAY